MDDQTLLSQYVATGDASAFAELTHRYSALVRGICFRLLGNTHDAEEVTQECFFELARHASDVHTSLGGWLQRAATSRSLNAIRSRIRRKNRERKIGLEIESIIPAADYSEPDLHRTIQGALKELPENLRLPMVLHYVDGQSQRDVAAQLGVNQSTISRRMQDALQQLREKLTQAGYAATAPAMMVLMQDHAAAAMNESGSPEIAAPGTIERVAGSTTLVASLMKGIVTASLPILGFLLFDGWVSLFTAMTLMVYIARFRPIWVSEVMSNFGLPDLYRQPTFFLNHWNWTSPPQGWRRQVRTSIIWSSLFAGLALTFAFGSQQPPWGTVVLGLAVATVCFCHACRLWSRAIRTVPSHGEVAPLNLLSPHPKVESLANEGTWMDVTQLISTGLIGTGVTIPAVLQPQPGMVWPAVTLCAALSVGMTITGMQIGYRLFISYRSLFNGSPLTPKPTPVSAGTTLITIFGAFTVAALSVWILWNPTAVPSSSLSLAAVQTSMLGWMVYRIATFRTTGSPHLIRRVAIAILVGCFVLNSGIGLANWLPLEFKH